MANDDYREQHERDRAAGLAARHETRVERAIREDPMKALRYLLAQYDRVVEVHEHVVMDTPEDRELHDRAIATFKEAAEPIRKMLAPDPPKCPRCHGYGYVPDYKNWDHNLDEPKPKPCPECAKETS